MMMVTLAAIGLFSKLIIGAAIAIAIAALIWLKVRTKGVSATADGLAAVFTYLVVATSLIAASLALQAGANPPPPPIDCTACYDWSWVGYINASNPPETVAELLGDIAFEAIKDPELTPELRKEVLEKLTLGAQPPKDPDTAEKRRIKYEKLKDARSKLGGSDGNQWSACIDELDMANQ